MKTFKQLMLSLSIIGIALTLFIGGCKKELPSNSAKLKNADLLMSKEAGPGKKKVLRQSPGLKFEIKGETIERISPTLKNIDKITSILNEEQSKKNQGAVMTTKSATFTASLAGTYYNCYAELNDPGPYDWYLINWYTGVYTYIGSSSDYINFNVQKPSMYGSYRVWGEGPYGAGFTGYQYLGDPYVGVSKVGGVLEFTDATALDNIIARLENAYEDHQANFFDSRTYMTDDQINNYAEEQGFDEFLPLKEFEAFMGFSSLRQYAETQMNAYNLNSDLPEPLYDIDDEITQTILTQSGQFSVWGAESQVMITMSAPSPTIPGQNRCNNPPGSQCSDQEYHSKSDTIGDKIAKKIVVTSRWQNSNIAAIMLRAHAKGKVIFFKRTGPKSRKRYATRINARVYGNAYTSIAGYTDTTCGSLIGVFDIGPTEFKTRYRRKARKDWPGQAIMFKFCEVTGEWNIPNHGFGTISLGLQ